MQNLQPSGAPPAGIHPREALRELCAVKRSHESQSRPVSARGPSPYAFWHTTTVERHRAVSPPRHSAAAQGTSPQPSPPADDRTPFSGRRPLSAVASRLSSSRNDRSRSPPQQRTSPARAGEGRPAPYVPALSLSSLAARSHAAPKSARALARPTTAPSQRTQLVGSATARACPPIAASSSQDSQAATASTSGGPVAPAAAPRPPADDRPLARPPRPHTAAHARSPGAAQRSPAVVQLPPDDEIEAHPHMSPATVSPDEGKAPRLGSPAVGQVRSPITVTHVTTSTRPVALAAAANTNSDSSAGVAMLPEGCEMSASASRRSDRTAGGTSHATSVRSGTGIRITRDVDDFMHSDDEDGLTEATSGSAPGSAPPDHFRFKAFTTPPTSPRGPGASPESGQVVRQQANTHLHSKSNDEQMSSEAPLSCSALPASPSVGTMGASGSLVNYMHTTGDALTVPNPRVNESPTDSVSMSSAASSMRKERVVSARDWSRKSPGAGSRSTRRPTSVSGKHSGSTSVVRDTMSESEIARQALGHWKVLIGYIHVKKAIRRWREDFALRSQGLSKSSHSSMKSMRSMVFAPQTETAEDVVAGFDNFEWIVTFAVPCVMFRGTPLEDAVLHISTTHVHFSTDDMSSTVRLSDILGVSPSDHGLTIKLAKLAPGQKRQIAELHEGTERKRLQRRRSMSVTSLKDHDNTIEVETEEASYIALHIFDFQSRILRSYATTLSKTLNQRMQRSLHVVHFNDVYHLPPFKPASARGVVGGASRFHTVLKEIRENFNPLVLFSGDFMGPSLMSVITKGKQMIDALNFLGVHYGCYGNHEFDYGLKTLKEVIFGYTQGKHIYTGSQTTWVMSNMTEGEGDTPLGGAKKVEIFVWNGVRVGLIGICENWIPQCNQLRPGEATYHDMFEVGESMALRLKEEEGCEIVLALTHNRLNLDKELMAKCPSIDFLLGGHDHFYKSDPKSRVLKSGQEFEYLSFVEFAITEERKMGRVRIDTKPIMYDTPQSDYMRGLIERYDQKMKEKLGKPIGTSAIPLDSTEETIRFKEGLLPNFILDIMEDEAEADFAVLGAAAIAGKEVKPPGAVTIGDVFGWFPNDTRIMKMKLKGSTIRKMLDAMVRELPAEAPSFPHPSRSLSFTINMIFKPPRVVDVRIKGQRIGDDDEYSVAVEEFVGVGKAKYKFVPVEGETLVNDENASQLVHWVMDFFTKHKGKEKSAESQAREEALKTVGKVVAHAARIEIDADVEKSQKFVRSVITELLKCDRSSVFLVDPDTGELTFIPDGAPNVIRIPKGIGIAGHVAVNNEEFNIADVYEDPRFNRKIDMQTGYRTRSMLAIPVSLIEGNVIAVVQAINKDPEINGGVFDEVDALKLRLLGEQVGFQLRNGEIFRDARNNAIRAELQRSVHDSPTSNVNDSPAIPTRKDTAVALQAGARTTSTTSLLLPPANSPKTPQDRETFDVLSSPMDHLSVAFDATTLQKLSPLSDHMVLTYKAFASEVSLSAQKLMEMIIEYALRLVPSDNVRVFVRDATGENIITLVDDVEDDETVATYDVEAGTVLEQCLLHAQTVSIPNARDTFVTARSRLPNVQTAMAASMTTSDGDIVGVIFWFNRRDTEKRRFQPDDEWAAGYFAQFAAVSHANTMRMQNMEELRAEMNLQCVPDVQLGRIKTKGGWATVRRLRKDLPRIVAEAQLRNKRPSIICVDVNRNKSIIEFGDDMLTSTQDADDGAALPRVSATPPNRELLASVSCSTKEGSNSQTQQRNMEASMSGNRLGVSTNATAAAARHLTKSIFANKAKHAFLGGKTARSASATSANSSDAMPPSRSVTATNTPSGAATSRAPTRMPAPAGMPAPTSGVPSPKAQSRDE